MNPIPKMATGEAGRLAYGISGTPGQIFHPRKLSFVEPKAAAAPAPMESSALAVGVYAARLAIQAETATETPEALAGLEALAARLGEGISWRKQTTRPDDYALDKVKAVDTEKAEHDLRHGLEKLVRNATVDGEVDLFALTYINDDLQLFFDAVKGFGPGGGLGIELGPDLRALVATIADLLAAVRYVVYRAYNADLHGDPAWVITFNPTQDYLYQRWGMWNLARNIIAGVYGKFAKEIAGDIQSRFTLAGTKDFQHYKALIRKRTWKRIALPSMDQFTVNSLPVTYKILTSTKSPARQDKMLEMYKAWWLEQTDAGLLYRAKMEAEALREGYEATFYHRMPSSLQAKKLQSVAVDIDVQPSQLPEG